MYDNSVRLLFIILSAFFLFSCAENPVTKTKEIMVFSEADEVRFGRNLDEEIRSRFGIYEDLAIKRYIEKVGRRLASYSHRPHLDFSFEIVDSDEVNAFALPGGFIYVTRGLLCYLNNEAQLAGVLGHEIGHVSYRHSMKALQATIGANILLNIIALGTGSQFWVQISDISLQAIMAGYSREFEYQADNLSVEYAIKAGYDPYEIRNFFLTIEKMESGRQGPLVGIFADHPLTEKRIKNVEERISEMIGTTLERNFIVKEEDYLSVIDGLPLQKKKGWVREKSELKHGDLGVSIPYVRGFVYDRGSSPDELVIYDTHGGFAIEIVPVKGKAPHMGGIEEFEKKKGLKQKVSFGYFKDKNIPLCTYMVRNEKVQVAYIDLFPHTLAISFVERTFSRGGYLFDELLKKTRRMTKEEASLFSVERIKVYEVNRETTVSELIYSLSGKSDEKLLKRICLLNGMSRDQVLKPGKKIKLIVGGEGLHL
jgi:predicted Zn-dependent protease